MVVHMKEKRGAGNRREHAGIETMPLNRMSQAMPVSPWHKLTFALAAFDSVASLAACAGRHAHDGGNERDASSGAPKIATAQSATLSRSADAGDDPAITPDAAIR
jgi:hypothetical protein